MCVYFVPNCEILHVLLHQVIMFGLLFFFFFVNPKGGPGCGRWFQWEVKKLHVTVLCISAAKQASAMFSLALCP